MIPVEDFFEIDGVEEAAHLMFCNEKGHLGKKLLENFVPEIQYFRNEMERRALTWKIAYAKRYFPQYTDYLRETVKKINEI